MTFIALVFSCGNVEQIRPYYNPKVYGWLYLSPARIGFRNALRMTRAFVHICMKLSACDQLFIQVYCRFVYVKWMCVLHAKHEMCVYACLVCTCLCSVYVCTTCACMHLPVTIHAYTWHAHFISFCVYIVYNVVCVVSMCMDSSVLNYRHEIFVRVCVCVCVCIYIVYVYTYMYDYANVQGISNVCLFMSSAYQYCVQIWTIVYSYVSVHDLDMYRI